ncbi:MAG: SAV_2336 N-terminal domain-related protein [Scytonema sp. PMC 1070.18]|nr:SAV_2336 N-terminal domain-related protein [Scytonema sp. PMC 1070.18]
MAGEKDKWWEDETEVAELIWCAAHLHRIIAPLSPKGVEKPEDWLPPDGGLPAETLEDRATTTPTRTDETEPRTPIAADLKNPGRPPASSKKTEPPSSDRASPIRVPDPFPLPKPAAITKTLLPLAKRVPGILVNDLDIDATIEQTAEANGLLMIAFRPPLERWFEVHLLIDRSPSMAFWGDLAEGVATLFRWQGFFRDVRVWQFETGNIEPRLFSGPERIQREIRTLIAPGRNRLFIALTDTLGKAWHSGKTFEALAILGEQHPVAIAHVFPQSLWRRTALQQGILRPLLAPQSGCANSMLKVGGRLHTKAPLYRFPIFNLSPNHFTTWANFLVGSGGNSIQGILIRQEAPVIPKVDEPESVEEKPEDLLRGFLSDASPEARELAKVLAAVPLFPPVMRLAQQRFLPDSQHWHLAEVFFSGLLQRSPLGPEKATVPETWYEFKPEIRELLLANSSVLRTAEIWREIGDFIEHHLGSLRDFQALIPNPEGSIQDAPADRDFYFAEVKAAVLMTWGGEYATQAKTLREQVAARKRDKQGSSETGEKRRDINLQRFEFEVALIEVNESAQVTTANPLEIADEMIFTKTGQHLNDIEQLILQGTLANQTYQQIAEESKYSVSHLKSVALKLWEVLSEAAGEKVTKKNLQNVLKQLAASRHLTIRRHRQQAQCFIEDLVNGVQLEMVAIPEGSFLMGSPEDEPKRSSSESPQHRVTIQPFFLGKYPITQAQWQAVASLPQVNRELDPNPSRFKGENRPVENVFWYDTIEFCERLSQYTGKPYRLPSEAEWEYACRAGTTTPFHFGETITSGLANYDANYTYGQGPKGIYRKETTPVGSFGVANAFGLYDMHGNVREWCADHWHKNYEGAPVDGTVRLNKNDKDNQVVRMLRGGSWYFNPESCRSAVRCDLDAVLRNYYVGFRVACAAAWTE